MKLKFLPFLLPLAFPPPSFSGPGDDDAAAIAGGQIKAMFSEQAAADDFVRNFNKQDRFSHSEVVMSGCLLHDPCTKHLMIAMREHFILDITSSVKNGKMPKAKGLETLKGLRLSVQDPGTRRMITLAEGYINSLKEF